MKLTKCKNCGASDFVRIGDKYVCQYCGTEYPIPEEELEKEKQANSEKNLRSTSSKSQNVHVSHSTEKSGYVDASPKKPPKKKLSRNSQIVIGVVILAVLLLCYSAISDSNSDKEDDDRTIAVETEAAKNAEKTEASSTKKEEGATNVEVQKTDNPGSVISDFNYNLSGNEVMLQSYRGDNSILEIYPSYTIDGVHYSTNLMDFQVSDNDVKTIIFDEGITEVRTSIFNSCDVETIYFPSSMINVYDYTLAYLHPDDGEKIKIYYGGTEEQWYSIFTEYQRTKVSDATSAAEAGGSIADALNEFIGVEYDSSEFEYFFNASPEDLR